MADPTRPLTLSDLWLRGDVLDGALLRGWNGPVFWFMHTDGDSADTLPSFERIGGIHVQELEPDEAGGRHLSFIPNERFGRHVSFPPCLDFTRPEVRDRAVRVLGPDLLPIHAAELRGDITPGEAAGLVWCSVVRREAGLPVTGCVLGQWRPDGRSTYNAKRSEVCGWGDELGGSWAAGTGRRGWWFSGDIMGDHARGREIRDAGRAAADAAAIAAGYSLREPSGLLLLPLPNGVVGRLECSR